MDSSQRGIGLGETYAFGMLASYPETLILYKEGLGILFELSILGIILGQKLLNYGYRFMVQRFAC